MILAAGLLIALPVQQVGGTWQFDNPVHGGQSYDRLGTEVLWIGDVNGDGYDDWAASGNQVWYRATVVEIRSGADSRLLGALHEPVMDTGFGQGLAAIGDQDFDGVPDLAVGAPRADPGGLSNAGTVYFFSLASGQILREFHGFTAGDLMGSELAGAGDVDGDQVGDLLMGAHYASPGGMVLLISGASLNVLHQIVMSNSDHLGSTVLSAGDVDGDGIPDFAAADEWASSRLPLSGMVLVWSGATGLELCRLHGEEPNDTLGSGLANAGDVDGDGYDELFVSAPNAFHRPTGTYPGRAYLYSPRLQQILLEIEGEDGVFDSLGRSVAAGHDLDGDGSCELVMTANEHAGSSYWRVISIRSSADGAELGRISSEPADSGFAFDLAAGGTGSADGRPRLLIGTPSASQPLVSSTGRVDQLFFHPLLAATQHEFSAAAGTQIGFRLEFPGADAGLAYLLLASATGRGPVSVRGVDVPLTPDALTMRILAGPLPGMSNWQGSLDAEGGALAGMTVPAGAAAAWIGRTLWIAAVSFAAPGQPERASIALPLAILP